jgi:hypothetical protein
MSKKIVDQKNVGECENLMNAKKKNFPRPEM